MSLHIEKIKTTLESFALAHRDSLVSKRFSTYVTGVAGIGKTEAIKQIATKLDMAVVITHVSQLEPSDLVGIPRSHKITDGLAIQKYDLPGYLPLAEKHADGSYVMRKDSNGIERPVYLLDLLGSKIKNRKELREKHGNNWQNEVKGVILFLDEINRAVSDDTKQAIFELPGDYSLHEYEVPPGCVIFAAGNPANADYEINSMDEDTAWMDRFIHLDATTNIDSVLKYFSNNNVHPSIVNFLSDDPTALIKKPSPYKLNIDPSPRSYERLSRILNEVILPNDRDIFLEICIGSLGSEYGTAFASYYFSNTEKLMTLEDICLHYEDHREYLLELVHSHKNSEISAIMRGVYTSLLDEKKFNSLFFEQYPDKLNTSVSDNFNNFLLDLDNESFSTFIKKVSRANNPMPYLNEHFLVYRDDLYERSSIFLNSDFSNN